MANKKKSRKPVRARHLETVLVVDDSVDTVEVLRRNLEMHGYSVLCAHDCSQAMEILETNTIDLVVTDLRMPGASGLDLVRHIRENLRGIEVLMITGYPSIETAVKAVRHGAVNYLAKPFTDDELLAAIEEAAMRIRARKALRDPQAIKSPLPGMIGRSPPMLRLYELMEKAARSRANVLLRGEPGTGKELVARAIHLQSDRLKGPFVTVHCGSIPKGSLEQELFGDTDRRNKGLFHLAQEGSLYLDDFTFLSLADQERLAHFLERKSAGRGRGARSAPRFFSATDRDIESLQRAKSLRSSLVHQLGVIEIEVPPLRDRGEDLFLLARYFAETFAKEIGIPVPAFSERAIEVMKSHSWPGNVSELGNIVRRLVAMSHGASIDVPDLPALMRFHIDKAARADRSLEEMESEHILRVLDAAEGNMSRAAEVLGIDRKTLRAKLKRIRTS